MADQKFNFGNEGGPLNSYAMFLPLNNTEGGPFLMLRFEVRSFIGYVRNNRGRTISYATFLGPVLSLDMLEIQRTDHFLCYVSGSALSIDLLEIKRVDHFLFCVSGSALSYM